MLYFLGQGKHEPEDRSFSFGAVEAGAAPVLLDDGPGDVEAAAGSCP